MLERQHPAPRRAKKMDPFEAELLPHGSDLLAEDGGTPLDVLRTIGVATADLVVEHDRPLARKPLEGPEVVVRRARAAVHGEQWRDRRIEVADEPVRGPV